VGNRRKEGYRKKGWRWREGSGKGMKGRWLIVRGGEEGGLWFEEEMEEGNVR
jgi:hypothetical protein